MSEKTTANNIFKYGKAIEPQSQMRKEDEEDHSPGLADDVFDDSSSSYCTALCSLSDYSEALEDEECMFCAEPLCRDASFGPKCADPPGGRSTSTWPEISVQLKELKTNKKEDIGTSQVSPSARDPLSLQSKPFLSSSTNVISLNSVITDCEDAEQYNDVPLKDVKKDEDEDTGTSLHIVGAEFSCIWDKVPSSARDPLSLQSKPFLSSSNAIHRNSKNSADLEQYSLDPIKKLKQDDDIDLETSQDILSEESLCLQGEVSSSARDPLSLQSKPFSSLNTINVNSVITYSEDVKQYSAVPLKELKPDKVKDFRTSQQILGEKSLYISDEVSQSARNPLSLPSKKFPSSLNFKNLNSVITDSEDVNQYKDIPAKDVWKEEDEDIGLSQVSLSARDTLLLQSKPFSTSSTVVNVSPVISKSADSEKYTADPLKELKEEEDEDVGTSLDIPSEKSLYVKNEVSSPARYPLLLRSKPFPSSTNVINPIITKSADADEHSADLLRANRKESFLKPWDYISSTKSSKISDGKLVKRPNTPQTCLASALTEKHLCQPSKTSSPGKDSLLLDSSSSPKGNLQNLNTINSIDTEIKTKAAQAVDASSSNSLLNSWDYIYSSKTTAQTNTLLVGQSDCLKPSFISNTDEVNQYTQEGGQQQCSIKLIENPLTLQQSLRDGPNKLGPEDKLDRGGSIVGHTNWEGEVQGRRVEKEQAELSLKARNRKPPACCISTLTANKQKSGIPPRCYSERFLATGHQHRSPPVSWRWQKQSRQGVLLSSSLPPKPCSTSRQHSSTADNTKDLFNMATKLAKTNTEVRSLDTLDHTKSSCPEANYLDVFSSSRWSSNQLSPDEGFHDLSTDVLSFKLPMTKSHNTSACSEASSVECIDVALESHEQVNRGAKTVPKRQIQLKRRDITESQTNEYSSNDGLLVPATSSRPRDILQRQHSTPAAFHQDSELKLDQTERKQRLQKSLSLDETSSKTKKASCLIKTILSKKMQEEENLRTFEVPDRTIAPFKAYNTTNNNEHLTTSTKEVCIETTTKLNMTTGPLLSYSTSSQSTVKEHISVSSKIQPKPMTKHSFNPLFSGKSEFLDIGTEMATFPEIEEEKKSPSQEAACIASQSSGEMLSCDSAKAKEWNLSAGMGKQAMLKTTPEECFAVLRGHKQHNVKTDPITSMENQVKQGERKEESTQCITMAGSLAYELDVGTSGTVLSPSGQCSPGKEQEHEREDSRPLEQSVNIGNQGQGKFKAITPVHVVRDMRSLVKNTYSLSFRGPGEVPHGTENSMPGFSAASPYQISNNWEDRDRGKRYKQDQKIQVQKVIPPVVLDRIKDLASFHSTPKGCVTKPTALLESHEKSASAGFTKVSPIIAAKANSCALSKSPEKQYIQKSISQVDVHGNITNLKQTNRARLQALQSKNETSTEISKNRQSEDSGKLGNKKCKDSLEQQQHLAQQYSPSTLRSEELESCKPSEQIFSAIKDDCQIPGPPPRPQSTALPTSACILTVAPTPVLPPYFYKANPLGYQTVSPHMGTVSYVQGPVLLQAPLLNQPATANCPIPLMRSLSEEVRLLSHPFQTNGSSLQQSLSQQTENGEIRMKMASSDAQQPTAFVATLGAEVIQGSTSMLYPEMGVGLAQSPRQLLLDPGTGRCFYVDMPQLPQRKMLFDPQTCQYVEVLLPQQTIPSTVMPSPCAIPVPSINMPAIYTPQCLPYVQAHPQLLPPPGP